MAKTKPPLPEAKALRTAVFRQRIVKPKKGKGAYTRRPKHSRKGDWAAVFLGGPLRAA